MIEENLIRKLQNREFGKILNCGADNSKFAIYSVHMKDGSRTYISGNDLDNIAKEDKDLFDSINRALQFKV